MKRRKKSKKFKYIFDGLLSKGPSFLGFLTVLISFLIVILIGVISYSVANGETDTLFSGIWEAFIHLLDPGVLSTDSLDSVTFIILMILTTLIGIMVTSVLISIFTTCIENQMVKMRKGKCSVVESNHTVVLGYEDQTLTILEKLVEQFTNSKSKNKSKLVIVVLSALKEKDEMEDEIKRYIGTVKNVKIKCRKGLTFDAYDLRMCRIEDANRIIISTSNDNITVKSLLAVNKYLLDNIGDPKISTNRIRTSTRTTKHKVINEWPNISTVIENSDSYKAARIATRRSYDTNESKYYHNAEIIHYSELISRIIAQTCRYSGFSRLFDELFDFYGYELYLTSINRELKGKESTKYNKKILNLDTLHGKNIHDINMLLTDSIALGFVRRFDEIFEKKCIMLPSDDDVFTEDDHLILLSIDDGNIIANTSKPVINNDYNIQYKSVDQNPRNVLVIGKNKNIVKIIRELSSYLENNSSVTVILPTKKGSKSTDWRELETELEKFNENTQNPKYDGEVQLANLNVSMNKKSIDVTQYENLREILLNNYDAVLVLNDEIEGVRETDAETLVTLLQLKSIISEEKLKTHIITELHNKDNQDLIKEFDVKDYIVSRNITSLLISQISKHDELLEIIFDLISVSNVQIKVKPASLYFNLTDDCINLELYTIIDRVSKNNEIYIAYRKGDNTTNEEFVLGVPDCNGSRSKNNKISCDNTTYFFVLSRS